MRSSKHGGHNRKARVTMAVQPLEQSTQIIEANSANNVSLYLLKALAMQASLAAGETIAELPEDDVDLASALDMTLDLWVWAIDQRAKETEGHTQRVAEMTVRVARVMGMSENELVHVRRGAKLHDIGKMNIPDKILLKPIALTDDEWSIMRRHPIYAYELLLQIPYLHPAIDIPFCHHEKWDGTGYPRGIRGEEIPLAARIFAVVDVWDAMRSPRPYRPGWLEGQVRLYIHEQSFTHFDPKIVDSFLQMDLEKE